MAFCLHLSGSQVTRGLKPTPYQHPGTTIGQPTIVIIPEYKEAAAGPKASACVVLRSISHPAVMQEAVLLALRQAGQPAHAAACPYDEAELFACRPACLPACRRSGASACSRCTCGGARPTCRCGVCREDWRRRGALPLKSVVLRLAAAACPAQACCSHVAVTCVLLCRTLDGTATASSTALLLASRCGWPVCGAEHVHVRKHVRKLLASAAGSHPAPMPRQCATTCTAGGQGRGGRGADAGACGQAGERRARPALPCSLRR